MTELTADVQAQEAELLSDADSVSNTIGPMALPVIFLGLPIFIAIVAGLSLNIVYKSAPPLIFGIFSPAWAWLPVLYPIEFWYWFKSGQGAWKPRWIDWRYWRGDLHTDIQVRIDRIVPVGRATEQVVLKKGETEPRKLVGVTIPSVGFVEKPDRDQAGDNIYEFWFKNKHFPLAILALPYTPEEMLNFIGNRGIVLNGGFIFGSENVAAVDFVRTSFTRTDTIPFIPVGVLGFCAKMALGIRDKYTTKVPVAVEQSAGIADTFHATEWRRVAENEKKLREKIEQQERDIDKLVERRVGEILKHHQKGGDIKMPGRMGRIGGNGWLVGIVIIIAAVVLFLRFG